MARWGRADFSELEGFMQKLNNIDIDALCEAASKELAARLLALVIPKTPVGQYPKGSGKVGGTLRRGWTSKTHDEAAGGSGRSSGTAGKSYAQTLPITKNGNTYTVEIINPVEYASYVEFGHRTRNGAGWVEGKYMLTISEEKLKKIAPNALEKLVQKAFVEACNGGN